VIGLELPPPQPVETSNAHTATRTMAPNSALVHGRLG
jgi:hypothetical protein